MTGAMAESRTSNAWAVVLVLGALVTAGAVVLPDELSATLVAASGLTFLVFAFRRAASLPLASRQAWLIVSLAGTLMVCGGIARALYGSMIGVEEPLPSPADVLSVTGYSLVVVGQIVLIRRRSPMPDYDAWIDATVATSAIGLALWALVLSPYFSHAVTPLDERLLNAGYFVLTLTLLVTTIRLAIGSGHRPPSYYLFAACVVVFFATDFFGTLAYAQGWSKKIITILTPPVYALFCAALYHPSVVRLTDPPIESEPQLSFRRLLMLAGALMMPPLVLVYELTRQDPVDRVMVVVSALAMAVLVLVRMTRLVRARERLVRQEQALRKAGEHLVAATTQGEVSVQAVRACRHLLDGTDLAEVALVSEGQLRDGVDCADGWSNCVHISPLVSRGVPEGALLIRSREPLSRSQKHALDDLAREVALARRGIADAENLHRLRTEQRFRALFENSSDLISILDSDGRVVSCSPAIERILGRSTESAIGHPPLEHVHPEDRWRARAVLHDPVEPTQAPDPVELRMRHFDGTYRWFEVMTRKLGDEIDEGGVVVNAREITDRKGAERRLSENEARFRALVQNSSDVVAVIDRRGHFTYMSPAVVGVLGYRADDLVGTNVLSLLTKADVERALRFRDLLESEDSFGQTSIEVQMRDRSGTPHLIDVTVTDLRREPAVKGVVLNARDVTARKQLEENLRHQSLHDPLTGLGNRAMFVAKVSDGLARASGGADATAVMFLDLDDFKTVNDSLGHAVGDRLLIAVSERLQGCLEVSDTAARLGGDEFAILIDRAISETEVLAVADRILDSLREPMRVSDRAIEITASIGIALNGDGRSTTDELLRNADMAMYLAKEHGKGRFEVFAEGMRVAGFERLEMKAALRRAVDEGELILYFQPILEIGTGVICGAEALVRWKHPEKGVLGPGAFVPLAEETGLILPLGRWVLDEAVRQLSVWRNRSLVGPDFKISVNVSVRQMRESDLVEDVHAVLDTHGVPSDCLTVEITESLLVDREIERAGQLEALRALGVSIAVDDFGTGYSGLNYLQRFSIDVLKIDRSFVDGLKLPTADVSVVRTVIELARRVGARTVAEGIECQEQFDVLQDLGCEFAQGFLFSKPLPPAEFATLVASGTPIEEARSEPVLEPLVGQ